MNSYEAHSNLNRPGKGIKDRDISFFDRDRCYSPYDLLCLAVIKQAAKDTVNRYSAAYKFWTSEWYDFYTTNLPEFENIGEQIRDRLVSIGGLRGKIDDD